MAKAERTNRIAVTFHVPDGSSPAASALFLQTTVNGIFESAANHVPLGDTHSSEIMFSFHRPLVNSNDLLEEFFKNLRELFRVTVSYSPHFTQLPELPGGRN